MKKWRKQIIEGELELSDFVVLFKDYIEKNGDVFSFSPDQLACEHAAVSRRSPGTGHHSANLIDGIEIDTERENDTLKLFSR